MSPGALQCFHCHPTAGHGLARRVTNFTGVVVVLLHLNKQTCHRGRRRMMVVVVMARSNCRTLHTLTAENVSTTWPQCAAVSMSQWIRLHWGARQRNPFFPSDNCAIALSDLFIAIVCPFFTNVTLTHARAYDTKDVRLEKG